ncbi:MAG TPA: flavin reductase family protein [Clostridia bacterium]|nr:flavin reductase family protein [Clostridia bacterium]HRX41259.1 flavin reductase family protein [Clostridia bacterium]
MTEKILADVIEEAVRQLSRGGAFLTTSNEGEKNTMTISWAAMGRIWNKPVVIVAVRYSRYSYRFIDESGEFTVSFPAKGQLADELVFCGTKSGRDTDKFRECSFEAIEGSAVSAPLIDKCHIHIECKVIYKQAMEPGNLDESIKDTFYKPGYDYHVMYYGEVKACHIDD